MKTYFLSDLVAFATKHLHRFERTDEVTEALRNLWESQHGWPLDPVDARLVVDAINAGADDDEGLNQIPLRGQDVACGHMFVVKNKLGEYLSPNGSFVGLMGKAALFPSYTEAKRAAPAIYKGLWICRHAVELSPDQAIHLDNDDEAG